MRNWVVTRSLVPLGTRVFLWFQRPLVQALPLLISPKNPLLDCLPKEVFTLPIKIADGLDAITELKKEGIVTINEARARTQDIRPLKILILNLMPIKKPTEVQLLEKKQTLATQQKKMVRDGYLPSLNLSANWMFTAYTDKARNWFKSGPSSHWYRSDGIGLTLRIPIFDGLEKRSKSRKAQLDIDNAGIAYENAMKQMNTQYMNATSELHHTLTSLIYIGIISRSHTFCYQLFYFFPRQNSILNLYCEPLISLPYLV